MDGYHEDERWEVGFGVKSPWIRAMERCFVFLKIMHLWMGCLRMVILEYGLDGLKLEYVQICRISSIPNFTWVRLSTFSHAVDDPVDEASSRSMLSNIYQIFFSRD